MEISKLRSMQVKTSAVGRVLPAAAPAVAHRYRMGHLSPNLQQPTLQPLPLGLVWQQQLHNHQYGHQQQWAPLPPVQAASSSSSSSSSGDSNQQRPGGIPGFGWFDKLSQKTQLMIMGALLFIGMVGIPFLQPTFLYGDGSMDTNKPGSGQIVEMQEDANAKRALPCGYVPVASELYDFLQENSMPRTLPDGRSESPGVLRIYMSSMVILALFYACSMVLSLILNGVAGILRAVGIMGPAPPPQKPEDP